MKKVVDILQELYSEPNTYHKEQILRNWAISIIETCAGNFECSMEESDDVTLTLGELSLKPKRPVLHRGSILEVKRKL